MNGPPTSPSEVTWECTNGPDGPAGPVRAGWTRLNEAEANGVLGSADVSRPSPADPPLTSPERIIMVMAQLLIVKASSLPFDYHNETEWRRRHKIDIPGGELQSAATPADLTKGSFRNESGRAGTLLAVLK